MWSFEPDWSWINTVADITEHMLAHSPKRDGWGIVQKEENSHWTQGISYKDLEATEWRVGNYWSCKRSWHCKADYTEARSSRKPQHAEELTEDKFEDEIKQVDSFKEGIYSAMAKIDKLCVITPLAAISTTLLLQKLAAIEWSYRSWHNMDILLNADSVTLSKGTSSSLSGSLLSSGFVLHFKNIELICACTRVNTCVYLYESLCMCMSGHLN